MRNVESTGQVESDAAIPDRMERGATAILIGLILVAAVWLRWIALTSAGGMWRDEAHSIEMAADHGQALYHDSFPVLWLATLRTWLAVMGTTTDDFLIRLWGAFTGVLVIGMAIWAPWLRRSDPPSWAAIALLGLHPVFVVFGGETRGYGLGAACGLWMAGSVARLLFLGETRLRWAVTLVATLVAVQASFTNSPICAGIVGAGVLLQLVRRDWLAAARLLSIGLIAAASMLYYVATVFPITNEWAIIVKGNYGFAHYVGKVWESLSQAGGLTSSVWIAGVVALLVTGVRALVAGKHAPGFVGSNSVSVAKDQTQSELGSGSEPRDRAIYAALAVVIGTLGVLVYHRFLSVPTQVWYQMPILALWAFAIDLLWPVWIRQNSIRSGWIRRAVLVAAVLVAGWNTWLVSDAARFRLTNIDLVAKLVGEKAATGDLVVVRPFYYGISFRRYYRGEAEWMTIPEIAHAELPFGYNQLKAAMTRPEQVDRELERIARHLAAGGRLWLVAQLEPLGEGEAAGRLPVAPGSPYGWSEAAYEAIWSRQLTEVLRKHAGAIGRYFPTVEYPVNPFEHQPVFEIRGRRVSEPAKDGSGT